jgi:1-deoxy-D-xylulose-5-phosphate reductoisomerase
MKKTISILGSTGSIGLTTLDIINNKKNYFQIELLSANKNFNLICKQIKNYNPKIFVITNLTIFKAVKKKYKKKKIKIINNFDSVSFKKKLDITISAIPGIVGLLPTLKMIKLSKKLLIANKESVICGWNLIKQKSIKYKTKIVPVDSEHFSILKLMENHSLNEIKKIYITASGGPFLNYKDYQMKKIKPKEALKHPKWKMGKKISIDSSTLMNKIFEFVEAQKLFGIPKSKLDILIHPESLVHAIIKFKNGLTKFIYHETTMIIPLANAIFSEKLDISDFFKNKKKIVKIESLTFKKVDAKIFPVIKILDKINKFPSTSIIINASNEILVDQFLQKKIPFLAISKIIMNILNDRNYKKYAIRNPKNINQINAIDNWARDITMKKLKF